MCGGPCESSNATCATLSDTGSSRVLNFYERSACTANVSLPDIPPGASSEFKIAGQFDALGTVDAVAFEAKAGAADMGFGATALAVIAAGLLCVV